MKVCTDCKFHRSGYCHHDGLTDMVTGEVRHPYPEPCSHMRSPSWAGRLCGPDAKFFEASAVNAEGDRT